MPGRKRKSEVHTFSWLREKGRLSRLDYPAQVDEDGVVVFNVTKVHAMAFKQFVIHQDIPPKEGVRRKKRKVSDDDESLNLHNLPELVLFRLIDFLEMDDFVSVGQVNTSLADFLNNAFVKLVVMPAKPSALEVISGRAVLRLNCCCNMRMLKNIENMTFQFDCLNLNMLKQLKLIGSNHEFRRFKYRLTDMYKNGLLSILSKVGKTGIKTLEFLTDGTQEFMDILKLVEQFPNLKEITLHGIGHFNPSASYFNEPRKVQKIITQTLANKNIKTFTLKNFNTKNKFIKIESETLEELNIECGKSSDLAFLNLPNLKKFSHESMYRGLYSAQQSDHGKIKNIIATGCTNLEWFNDVNLKDIPEGASGWKDLYDDWMVRKDVKDGEE